MSTPILVTGGTGTLGRLVVARLREAGCAVRVTVVSSSGVLIRQVRVSGT